MSRQVRIESGSGYQLLLAAASVADPRWRLVFRHASDLAAAWQRELGRAGLSQLAAFGRFGWLNLAGLAAVRGAGGARADLLALVADTDPAELHAIVLGGQRLELRRLLGPESDPVIADAVAGSAAARRAVRRALGDERTRLEVHRWLWQASSAQVHGRCRDLITRLPDQPDPDPAPMRAVVAAEGFEAALARVAPRLHYGPGALGAVALLASRAVDPVIVEIDLPDLTVIAHPPLPEPGEVDPIDRLRDLTRAVGDDVRLRILTELRTDPCTLPELCARLERPRTTLLHHLALLRGAGLIDVAVSRQGPNRYRLDPAGFADLASAVTGFATGDPDL